MAALSVVHDRIVKTLQDTCLELHSKSANKKAVLGELARTLGSAQAMPRAPAAPTALTELRHRLNSIDDELHSPIGDRRDALQRARASDAVYRCGGAGPQH